MSLMFVCCEGLTSLDVTGFKTDKVTDMRSMFGGCRSLKSLDLSGFKTDKVEDMSNMFGGCSRLTTIYAGDGWSTANVQYGGGTVHIQDKEFKDFVDNTLKAKGVKGINEAWKNYNSPTSPAYGDTDSYGTIDVPMRATAGNELKKQLAFAYGSDAEVPIVVDIDKNKRSWKTKDTIDMEELMSDDYSVSRMQASPYTKSLIVNFVSKKGNKSVNVEVPLTVIAGENSSSMLQTAYSQLEQLEKMPTGSTVNVGGYGQMTREQAMNLMYKSIQQAMLNTMTYYDQEASKEPR
jgi:surface protein